MSIVHQIRVPAMSLRPSAYVFDDGGRAAAGYKGFTGDCGVRAIAIATGLPYQRVYDELHVLQAAGFARRQRRVDRYIARCDAMGARPRRRHAASSPRDGMYRAVVRPYLAELGWRWTPTMQIGSGCKVHLRADELPSGRLIVNVSRHFVAVIDGVIHDTYDPSRNGSRCVYGYWERRP